MNSQIKKIFHTGTVRGMTALGTLLFNYALTINLSIGEVGIFLSLLTEITLLSTISRFGFESYLLLLIGTEAHSKESIGQLINTILKIVFALSLVITTITLVIHYHFHNINGLWLILILPFLSLLLLISNIYRGYKKPILSVIFENGGYLSLGAILIFIFTCLSTRSFISVYAGFSISIILLLLISSTLFCVKHINLTKIPNSPLSTIKPHIRAAFHLMLSNTSQMLLIWVPFIMVSFTLSTNETALYGLSQRLSFAISLFLTVVTIVMSPYFSKHFHEKNLHKLKSIYIKTTLLIFPLVLFFVGLVFLWSSEVLSYFGKEYIQATSVFRILLVSQALGFILGPIGTIYNMSNHAKRLSYITFLLVLLTAVCCIITSIQFGIIGVAYTSLIFTMIYKLALLADFHFLYYKD